MGACWCGWKSGCRGAHALCAVIHQEMQKITNDSTLSPGRGRLAMVLVLSHAIWHMPVSTISGACFMISSGRLLFGFGQRTLQVLKVCHMRSTLNPQPPRPPTCKDNNSTYKNVELVHIGQFLEHKHSWQINGQIMLFYLFMQGLFMQGHSESACTT